jgi:hypothetical protein
MAPKTVYQEFPLALENFDDETGTYQVSLQYTKEYGAIGPVQVKLNLPEIEYALGELQVVQELDPGEQLELGRRLADRLFPEPMRTRLIEGVQKAGPGIGIRLRLLVRDQTLLNIPWEYTYLRAGPGGEDRSHFLVLNPKISLVRHPAPDLPPQTLGLSEPGTIHLLAILANPAAPGFDPLDLDLERGAIVDALEGFSVEGVNLNWKPLLEDATYQDLAKRLAKKPEIFHFSGHGFFSEEEESGSLILVEDKTENSPHFLPAMDLAKLLRASDVRLAFLGACESSRTGGRSPWNGVAQALVASGCPAVVSMQYEVLNTAATVFSRGFYTALASGLTIDEAVSYGRLAMLAASGEEEMQWGIPTLYLQAWDGVLFPEIARQPPASAREIRKTIRLVIGAVDKRSQLNAIVAKRIKSDLKITIGTIGGVAKVIKADVIDSDVDVRVRRVESGGKATIIEVDDL